MKDPLGESDIVFGEPSRIPTLVLSKTGTAGSHTSRNDVKSGAFYRRLFCSVICWVGHPQGGVHRSGTIPKHRCDCRIPYSCPCGEWCSYSSLAIIGNGGSSPT